MKVIITIAWLWNFWTVTGYKSFRISKDLDRSSATAIGSCMATSLFSAFILAPSFCSDGEEKTSLPTDDTAANAQEDTAVDTGTWDSRIQEEDGPVIHNHSGATEEHALGLVQEAIEGMGFPVYSEKAPNADDRWFMGKHYLVWLDQTGFYGKMNGLWRLDAASGNSLDFVLREDGRPVNQLVVGENGLGGWPTGYRGAEHVEFPNQTPEPGEDDGCSEDWCNQYGLSEAGTYSSEIPHWAACDEGSPDWADIFAPVELYMDEEGLRIVYEGRLTKEADGDGTPDGDGCHGDWLFPDGENRPVYLRVGYMLYGDEPHLDRTMQLRNPEGNPEFYGPMSLIGGFVLSTWPQPHYLKRLNSFLRPEEEDVFDPYSQTNIAAGTWNSWGSEGSGADLAFGWLRQPFTLSGSDSYRIGRTATIENVGSSDNGDSGFCFCEVHGGLELGGGLLHGGVSTPIAGGSSTIEGVRRLRLRDEDGLPTTVTTTSYSPESDLSHGAGHGDSGSWIAEEGIDGQGHILFGPYATDWGSGSIQAVFIVQVANISMEGTAAIIDIYDHTSDEVLAQSSLEYQDFTGIGVSQAFPINAGLAGREGHELEARLYWYGGATIRVDQLRVHAAD
jgi:hypothetical protein